MATVLSGPCVDVERKPSRRTDPVTGEIVNSTLTIAHILDGRYVRACIVDDEYGVAPVKDDDVEAEVMVSINRGGQYPSISWRLLAPVAAPARVA